MKYISLFLLGLVTTLFFSCNPKGKTVINPLQFHWKMAGQLPDGPNGQPSLGLAGAVIGLSNNRLIIGGGSNFPNGLPWEGGNKKYYNRVYAFEKEGDSIINLKQNLSLPFRVAYGANCTTNKGIIVAGGENEDGTLDKVLLLNWDQDKQDLNIQFLPSLPQPLTAGVIIAINSQVYFAGGQNADTVSNKLYHLDLNHLNNGWDTLPHLPNPVTHTVLYAQSCGVDSCLYIVGGRKRNPDSTSALYNEVYEFNLKKNKWSRRASLPYAISAHSGLVWNDSTLLVFSGDRGRTFHKTEELLKKIADEKDSGKKERLIREKKKLQKSHPGFDGRVLAYNTRTDRWIEADSIPFPGQVTTTAIKWGNDIVIPGGEIRAGVRTANIIIGAPHAPIK